MMPSADEVAAVVVAVSRLMKINPEWVIAGGCPADRDVVIAVARARCYAAMAIDRVFNTTKPRAKHKGYQLSRVAIARMVGAPKASRDGFVNALESKLRRNHKMRWWDESVFDQAVTVLRPMVWTRQPAEKPAREPVVPERLSGPPAVLRRDPEPPQTVREPAPAPAPVVKPVNGAVPGGVKIERNGVSMDPRAWRITRGGSSVELRDVDAYLVTQSLLRVMPSILPTEILCERVWQTVRDAGYRVGSAVARANVVLGELGLKINALPKFGYALSEI